ncbi:hypothetical protein EC973_003821 [Apophysomyces ossiformis]|uniref:site-specific DNA-methyltransferase (adenine-specific) n=1 Tax=Apophysomyces ossiformis TaxID=679940 RepID=A0A8H7BXU6_9FUNG|nr:hypothetical protein EC973_003821 [Apophysomyces ossiformis]
MNRLEISNPDDQSSCSSYEQYSLLNCLTVNTDGSKIPEMLEKSAAGSTLGECLTLLHGPEAPASPVPNAEGHKRKWLDVVLDHPRDCDLKNATQSSKQLRGSMDLERLSMLDKPSLSSGYYAWSIADEKKLYVKDVSMKDTSNTVTTTDITEDDVKAVVNILGTVLQQVKEDVRRDMMSKIGDNGSTYVPSAAIQFLLRLNHTETSNDIDSPRATALATELYCLMTGFMTVYLVFIEILLQELLPGSSLEAYMECFAEDNVFRLPDDIFLWHHLHSRRQTTILDDLRQRLKVSGIRFRSLQLVDSIFSRFYTTHFLEAAAQKHRKDHGQFYTPQSVVRFMWNRCLSPKDRKGGHVPRVFDPCMGIGSFLCEFLTGLIDTSLRTPSICNSAERLEQLLHDIAENVWGVEIDPFAYHLGKLNFMVHLFPLYRRLVDLNRNQIPRIGRLRLFCNDTLKLTEQHGASLTNVISAWERDQLRQLRDATIKFDYIVTNPPYMIRKTGFITVPDPALYDDHVLGGKGTQAYMYFMWIALQRCNENGGQVCLITPSQWMVLEFAEHLRSWIWQHCEMTEIFQFEPYKVWPKVQTDSLIFCLRMRSSSNQITETKFLRHLSRKMTLEDILRSYASFDKRNPDPLITYKITPTNATFVHKSNHASFSFLSPTSSVSDRLVSLTGHLPKLCDGELRTCDTVSPEAPLVWHRGPNTHPVYALVVRTRWALDTFGKDTCERWLRPVFYWSGKSSSTSADQTSSKEALFWHNRDALRLSKENSPAEAYVPFGRVDEQDGKTSFYSMILVDKEGAARLTNEHKEYGDTARDAALHRYLSEARSLLQPNKTDRQLAWCHFNKCGIEIPVKIVHPINFGYFTRTQPRQRFFIDREQQCLTNQCMYFTIKPECNLSAEYFCGILNSSTLQFFIRDNCYYDQQGRTRFFGKHMARIPFSPPNAIHAAAMTSCVQDLIATREWIYGIIRLAGLRTTMEKVRRCDWDIREADKALMTPYNGTDWRQRVRLDKTHWIDRQMHEDSTRSARVSMAEDLTRLLKIASLFQYCIDHMAYAIYNIPVDLQQGLEQELGLALTEAWQETVHAQTMPVEQWWPDALELARSIVG